MPPVQTCSHFWRSHLTSLTSKTNIIYTPVPLSTMSCFNQLCPKVSFISRSFSVNVKAVLHVSQVKIIEPESYHYTCMLCILGFYWSHKVLLSDCGRWYEGQRIRRLHRQCVQPGVTVCSQRSHCLLWVTQEQLCANIHLLHSLAFDVNHNLVIIFISKCSLCLCLKIVSRCESSPWAFPWSSIDSFAMTFDFSPVAAVSSFAAHSVSWPGSLLFNWLLHVVPYSIPVFLLLKHSFTGLSWNSSRVPNEQWIAGWKCQYWTVLDKFFSNHET